MSTYGKGACIWHAYTALESQNKGEVLRSQLKVLTHNIANCLGVHDIENYLDNWHKADDASLTFTDYLVFLVESLFSRLRESDIRNGNAALSRIDDVCWFVCAPTYLHRQHQAALDEAATFKLWRVFNVLAEVAPDSVGGKVDEAETAYPVHMDWEEVLLLAQKVHRITGTPFDREAARREAEPKKSFSFQEVLFLVETKYLAGVADLMVMSVICELFDENILGVMKKGYLNKKVHVLTWKERWCVLTPTAMYYYTSRDEREIKGQIVITEKLVVEELPDSMLQKSNRFVIHAAQKDYELYADDPRTRTEWTSALKTAIKLHDAAVKALSKDEVKQRRISRFARREKLSKEELRQLMEKEEKEKALNQLEEEKRKRSEMEAKMREEEHQREMERDQLNKRLENAYMAREDLEVKYREKDAQFEQERQLRLELEDLQRHLEALLERERLAREMEATARHLQERALSEEREKKLQLESIQADMEKLLLDEQQKREDLEEAKQRQEAMLLEEKRQLERLEKESERRQRECEAALEKLREAENEKEEMKRQLDKKKVFIAKFTGEEPIFDVGSHRGADPGVREGLWRGGRIELPTTFTEDE